jgi:hypothetical protein
MLIDDSLMFDHQLFLLISFLWFRLFFLVKIKYVYINLRILALESSPG